ncbi:MAG: hypothetical protein AUG49_18250 [Catenulispora sp. 13_1_20CM_3_70_7]|nr:MAG: hypothetical protein AUG49_18250 [Catenulispora sp. 13_1_20CM_3_70_7]
MVTSRVVERRLAQRDRPQGVDARSVVGQERGHLLAPGGRRVRAAQGVAEVEDLLDGRCFDGVAEDVPQGLVLIPALGDDRLRDGVPDAGPRHFGARWYIRP